MSNVVISAMQVNSVNNLYITPNNVSTAEKQVDNHILTNTQADLSPLKKVSSNNVLAYHVSFGGLFNRNSKVDEKQYRAVAKSLSKEARAMLKTLRKNHILENKVSNDGSSVMDNLYKIATTERLQGLSRENILNETVKAIANPYTITQKFGDLPQEVIPDIERATNSKVSEDSKQVSSASCVATSIEFNIASKRPAEFVRMVEGLTSPKYSVEKTLDLKAISPNFTEAIYQLSEFNVDYKIAPDWQKVNVSLKPDRNAIIRARVQNSYKDPLERSSVDVLMQSTIMNLGSQHSYDSITDKRQSGKYNPNERGLTNMENNFAEKILDEKSKVSVVYQNLDENGILTNYNCDLDTTKQHILQALNLGQNIIIGYTMFDENKKVLGGHEITIVGTAEKNGKLYFICNDTDDNLSEPIVYDSEEFLPLIHHADLPAEIFPEFEEQAKNSWKYLLENLKNPNNVAA